MTILLDQRIVSDPNIRGGKPCLSGRRITVSDIVIWHELMGKTVDEISLDYRLSLTDIYVALAFYFANQKEIDLSLKESKAFAKQLKKQIPSKIK